MNFRCMAVVLAGGWLAAVGLADGQTTAPTNDAGRAYVDYFTRPSEGHRAVAVERLKALTTLSAPESKTSSEELWQAYKRSPEAQLRVAAARGSFVMVDGEALHYVMKVQGERGANGFAAFIDLHGGGGAPPEVNDRDWVVHQSRYKVPGKFFAVRAPRDTWDHFHNEYFHRFMDAMVEQLILAEDVDPDRVYIMGYSSGGYGTIQLGPGLADRFAAVACSAAATEGSRPENLRNTPFIYQIGENDTAYGRIGLAREYAAELRKLREADPAGYVYEYREYAGRGHGIDDRPAVGWMAGHTRQAYPRRVVWVQNQPGRESSNPIRHQRYWVAIDPKVVRDGTGAKRIDAEVNGQEVSLKVQGYDKVRVRLNDAMLDLDKPVVVGIHGKEVFRGVVPRRAETLLATFLERRDPTYAFAAELELEVPVMQPTTLPTSALESRWGLAGENAPALKAALASLAGVQEQAAGRWLIENMPVADLRSPEVAGLLAANVRLAVEARRNAPWTEMLSDELFYNYVLPYACVNERREEWRSDFYERFAPKVAGCKTPGEAAKLLNETIFKELGVSYHPTKRPKPDQSPSESVAAGYASCTGLTVLLVDACRAVGVPARFVGTPLWTTGKGDEQGNHAGNHSWVEVWDGAGWRAIGAIEPGELDACWFMDNASKSDPTRAIHRIYATAFGVGDRHFPMVWAQDDTSVRAVDVTHAYIARKLGGVRKYECARATGEITIDGKADEAAWADVPWSEDYVDIEGPTKSPPAYHTRMKMMWDDKALYILAELAEPHVWGTLTEKNAIVYRDNDFEVFIDPDGDGLNYYEFEINALGTIMELTMDKPYHEGGSFTLGTNLPGLRSAVRVDGTVNDPTDVDRGWRVEMAIPWEDLRGYQSAKRACPPVAGDAWRVNFSRVQWGHRVVDGKYVKIPKEERAEDNWVWSPTGVIDMHRPEHWGVVEFVGR